MSNKGVLLVNLGSPDSTSVGDVRRYLREFLSDELVLDSPWPVRQVVLNLFILPSRPKESAEAYRSIWTEDGSPLIVTSEKVRDLLGERVDIPVSLAMRYGNPSIESGLSELLAQGVDEVFLIPLYPHYAMSSYETVVARVQEKLGEMGPHVVLRVQPPFYDDPDYLDALVSVASPHLEESDWDMVLFSYHGVPERHIRKRDPSGCYCLTLPDCCERENPAHEFCYRAQVFHTTRAFAERAGIPEEKYRLSFQSRLGSDPWLKPYTASELERLPQTGVERLAVICPAFVADCLETLEEIDMEGRDIFLEAGGEEFTYIPCLNDHPRWIDALEGFVGRFEEA